MSTPGPVTVLPVTGVPEVSRGADLGALLLAALSRGGVALQDGDVLVVSSKVVSKAMGLRVPHDPDAAGAARAKEQEVLRRSRAVVAERRGPAGSTRV
ncbi:coenzyme F420-0:L-glutamate ligase, partial [Ornithinicoccus halotolerans]|uniref:coenzyme F420-0:L-glutamate ligase n=1 Tax=Ornithinicoccus halotolerans TaxID=1748220 RepID=UPI001885DE25